jgi:hypothetical protein
MEQDAARAFKPPPTRARIYFAERIGHRAAAPQRHAEVVNCVGIPVVTHLFGTLDHAVHPELKTNSSPGVVGR